MSLSRADRLVIIARARENLMRDHFAIGACTMSTDAIDAELITRVLTRYEQIRDTLDAWQRNVERAPPTPIPPTTDEAPEITTTTTTEETATP